jgi:hypothetical protein
VLHTRRVGGNAQLPCGRGDLARYVDLPLAVPAEELSSGDRGQTHGHTFMAQIDVGQMRLVDLRQVGDGLNEGGTRPE